MLSTIVSSIISLSIVFFHSRDFEQLFSRHSFPKRGLKNFHPAFQRYILSVGMIFSVIMIVHQYGWSALLGIRIAQKSIHINIGGFSHLGI